MKIGIFVTFFFGSLFASESAVCQRANAHLIIHDYVGAEKECLKGLDVSPDSSLLQKVMIKALAEGGKGDEATTLFERFQLESKEPELLETLAWGIIKQSEGSTQLLVNLACLMSACHTNDVRATDLLLRSLSSSNAILRTYAAQLSPHYRDQLVIAKLLEMLRLEKVWFVRLEVIRALGMMEVKEAKDPLTEILIHPRVPSEEKGEAIAALINSWEEIGDHELAALIRSKRGGFRHLACQIVSHLDLKDKTASIEILLEDPIAEVRIAALNTLSFLGLKRLSTQGLSKIVDLTEDPNGSVALTAAWIISRFAPETACQVIKQSIYGTDDATRRLGALILGRIEKKKKRLAEEVLKIT
ncbi:MAG: HEAT repeat domain-containing protein, partial [Chlamydiia bacterium]|nr:HEAT repeat domain-containing protein [Chlamydiia bacterium]